MQSKEFQKLTLAASQAAEKIGTNAYLVGGSVRQLLAGDNVNDLDLVVDSTGDAKRLADVIASVLPACSRPVVISNFPTFEIRCDNFVLHINEAPKAVSEDIASIYAPISPPLKQDSLRRDFTVNTLLIPADEPHPSNVIDPLGTGLRDLERRVLRTPVDPKITLHDDPIRMIRAVRFCCVEGFEPARSLEKSISELASLITKAPAERINAELTKILTGPHPAYGLQLLHKYGLMAELLPELAELAEVQQTTQYHQDDVLTHTLKVMIEVGPTLRLRLSALFHDIGKRMTRKAGDGKVTFYGHQHAGAEKAREILKALRYPNKLVTEVTKLIEMHMIAYRSEWSDKALRRLVRKAGNLLDDLLLLYRADILARKPPYNDLSIFEDLMERIKSIDLEAIINAHIPLSGEEVMSLLGLPEGPEIGEAMQMLEKAIIDGTISAGKEEARDFLLTTYLLHKENPSSA